MFNVKRRSGPVSTGTVCFDITDGDDSSTCAQIFVGAKNLVADIYGMKIDKHCINTLEDNVRTRGAIDKLT